MHERNAVIGFVVLFVVMMGFYGLGLLLGRTDLARTVTVSPAPIPVRGPDLSSPDPRSDLDFINTVVSKNEPRVVAPEPSPLDTSGAIRPPDENKEAPAQGTFSVYVGSFDKEEDARRLHDELLGQGYSARVAGPLDGQNGLQFHVYVGDYENQSQADTLAQQLSKIIPGGLVKVLPAER